MNEIKILHCPTQNEPYVVACKGRGIPSAPLKTNGGESALSLVASLFPSVLSVRGKNEWEGGLIHRIDSDTHGLILLSTSQDFYDYMMKEQHEGRFLKTYTAVCDKSECTPSLLGGFPPYTSHRFLYAGERAVISSRFRAYGKGRKQVRPVISSSSFSALKKCKSLTLYSTHVKILSSPPSFLVAECTLKKGWRHQVRCHLAWASIPVKGDALYNADVRGGEGGKMEFYAVKIEFFLPFTHTKKVYEIKAPAF